MPAINTNASSDIHCTSSFPFCLWWDIFNVIICVLIRGISTQLRTVKKRKKKAHAHTAEKSLTGKIPKTNHMTVVAGISWWKRNQPDMKSCCYWDVSNSCDKNKWITMKFARMGIESTLCAPVFIWDLKFKHLDVSVCVCACMSVCCGGISTSSLVLLSMPFA